MTTGGFTDAVLSHAHDIQGGEDILQEVDVRARCLHYLQTAAEWLANYYPFRWRKSTAAITVSTDGFEAPTPTDFHSYGYECQVSRSADGVILDPRSDEEVTRLGFVAPTNAGLPRIWSPRSVSGIGLFPGAPSVALDMANYFRRVAIMTDGPTTPIDMIPEQYHRTILFNFVMSRLFFGAGDDRSAELDALVERQARQAIADENMTPVRNRLPRYGRGRW